MQLDHQQGKLIHVDNNEELKPHYDNMSIYNTQLKHTCVWGTANIPPHIHNQKFVFTLWVNLSI